MKSNFKTCPKGLTILRIWASVDFVSIFPIQIVDFKDDVEDDEEEVDEDEAIFSSATRVGLNQHKFTEKFTFQMSLTLWEAR